MVTACHTAGVKVYADAVINHMTGQGAASYGGASFTKYDYPGIYSPSDFHHYPNDCPAVRRTRSTTGPQHHRSHQV